MQLTSPVGKARQTAKARFVTWVTRTLAERLANLEHAHGETWVQLQSLKAEVASLAPLSGRITAVEEASKRTSEDLQELRTWVPSVLDASADQHAAARATVRTQRQLSEVTADHERSIDALRQRIEFIRRELMFELRYGGHNRGIEAAGAAPNGTKVGGGDPIVIEPKVLNESKLLAFGEDIRINLGAGHIPVDGYLNVDARELDGIDILADIRGLPFDPGTVSVVYSAHLLEHFPVEEVRRSLLPYWRSLLKPGGRLVAVVPDAEAMLQRYGDGEMSFDDLREVTFGGQEYDGDFHFNMFSRESLATLLNDSGFVDVTITASARRNGLCDEMQIEGVRPALPTPSGEVS